MADEKCTLVTEAVGNRPRRGLPENLSGLLPSSYTGAYGEGGVTKNISDQYLKYRTCSNSTWPIKYNYIIIDVGIGRGVNATLTPPPAISTLHPLLKILHPPLQLTS